MNKNLSWYSNSMLEALNLNYSFKDKYPHLEDAYAILQDMIRAGILDSYLARRLINMPCKIGDRVFFLSSNAVIMCCKISGICLEDNSELCYILDYEDRLYSKEPIKSFGVRIFSTIEDAVKAKSDLASSVLASRKNKRKRT